MSSARFAFAVAHLVGVVERSSAENRVKTFDFARFSGASADPLTEAWTGNARLGSQAREFDLNADGIAKTVSNPLPPARDIDSNGLVNKSDQSKPEARGRTASSDASKDYSGPPAATGYDETCGPSPLSPAEIETLVVETANRYSVDPELAKAIAWTESRYDRTRNSPKGARGPMQLMPATAAQFGVVDTCNPASNIDGGIRYLRRLLDRFKNPIIAAAAYNAGAQSIYDSGGVPAYPETVRYVASVINRQFGLEPPGKRQGAGPRQPHPDNSPPPSVIGAREPKFIGGVMQITERRIEP